MSNDKVTPTVGRRIWYWPSREDLAGMSPMEFIEPEGKRVFPREAQPLDAGILYVHDDGTVNLDVTDHLGRHWFREAVEITVSTGPLLDFKGSSTGNGVAQWMPYQTAAKKREVRRAPRAGDQLYYWPAPGLEAMNWKDETQPCIATVLYVDGNGIHASVLDQSGGHWTRRGWALPAGEHRYVDRKVGQFQWPQDFDHPTTEVPSVVDASQSGTAKVLTAALAANGLCRSAYAIAERMCRLHGPNAYGTNWAGFHNVLKDGLEAQHKVLKPYLAAEADRGNAEPFEDRLKRVTKDIGEVGDEHLPYPLADDTSTHETALSETEWRKRAKSGNPSNSEIDTMVRAYLGDCGPQATRVYSFVHAIISRWGTAPVVPCKGPDCDSTTGRDHSPECEKDHTMSATWGTTDIDKINLCYDGAYVHETEGQASVRRQVAEKLWGRGWQQGWSAGWQAHAMDVGDEGVEPATPQAPEYKA